MKQRRRAGRFLGLLLALVMLLSVGMQAFAADADVTGAMTGQRTGTEAAGTETAGTETDAAGKNGTESKTEESEESGTETKPEESGESGTETKPEESGESGTETKPEDGTESASESEMAGLNAVSPEAADSEGDFSNIGDLTFVSETGTADYSLNQTVQNLVLTTGASYDLAVYAGGAALGRNYSVSWESADSSTASVNSSGMITARQTGQTTVMATVTDRSGSAVGHLTIQVTVIDDGNGQYSREIEFYVADIQNTTLYYVENGHTGQFDFISVEEGTVIYGQTSGKWNLVYFAAPDEGYALTYLSAVNNYGQTDWTSIRNGQLVNPNNNYFETAYGTQYYNEVLQTAQGTYGCDGCFWFTRGNDESGTGACRSYIIAISEKLPTVEKTVAQVNGQTYTDGMEIHVGDTITFGVTVTRYESQYGISYSGAALNDTLSGACFQNSSSARKDISADLGSSTTAAGTYTYYVDYTVQEADLDTQIVNTVELSYSYRAQYSEGEYGGTAQAQARVSVLSFTPDDYIIDFGSPISLDFTGKSSYDFVSGNATFGTVAVNGKTVTYTPSSVLTEADTVTITNEKGAEFSFTVYPASNVYYEEGFASYSGAWTGGSSATADQTVSAVNDSTEDLYGYDSLYAAANGSSNDSLAVSSTANAAATFTFHGTGLDIYALTTQTSGSMSLWLYEGTGTDGTLLKLGYVNTSNNWLEGNDGNYYNTPVFSYTDLAAGTYTVKIVVTGGTVSLDGFRVYHTQGDAYETVYSQDQENAAQTVELRDIVIAGSTYDFNDVEDWYTYGNQIIDAVYNENGNGSGALILSQGDSITADADMINDGPKNEIYLEPGQTLAVRLTASDYGKVAVGMRSLNGGTVNYRLNGTDGSISSSVDLYYETKPQNGMLVITNTGSSVMALTKIRVTGLASGTSLASSFSVDTDTVVYALQCIAGEPEVTSENRFPDVPETEWYRDAVVWADAAGVATGYANGNFGPCDEITREQLAVMLYRYAQKNGMDVTAAEDLSRYEDADQVSAFARTAMEWAVAEGIISGKYDQTQLDPQGSATRAECATVIMRYMEKLEQQA